MIQEFTPKEIKGLLKSRGDTSFNDQYNLKTYGITFKRAWILKIVCSALGINWKTTKRVDKDTLQIINKVSLRLEAEGKLDRILKEPDLR